MLLAVRNFHRGPGAALRWVEGIELGADLSCLVHQHLGRIVEEGNAAELFHAPAHPYTRALVAATPSIRLQKRSREVVLSGELPSPASPPSGCVLRTHCPHAVAGCAERVPVLRQIAPGRRVACLRDDVVAQGA